jgi:RNA polymerase sigma factor (sigma-70 family)
MVLWNALNALAQGEDWVDLDSSERHRRIAYLFARYVKEIVPWIAHTLGSVYNWSAAEDILGDFFEKHLYDLVRRHDPHGGRSLAVYCRTRLEWMCNDYRDKHQKDPTEELDDDALELPRTSQVERAFSRSEFWSVLGRALPPEELLILRMAFLVGNSRQEIATRFDITHGAARAKLRKALIHARVQLRRVGFREYDDIVRAFYLDN